MADRLRGHKWQRGDVVDGSPTMECTRCKFVWFPDQDPQRIPSCTPQRKVRCSACYKRHPQHVSCPRTGHPDKPSKVRK